MEQPAVVAATVVADKNPAPDETRASTPTRGDETVGTPPRAVRLGRKTKLHPLLLMKKVGPQLQPQWRLLRRRATLAEVRVL